MCDKSLRQNLNQPMREHQLVSRDPSKKTFKMATEHVDQDKQHEQSEVSSTSGWNVTTSRMVIEFYKENRALWDKNHKGYGIIDRTRSFFLLHLRCIRWSAMLNLETSSHFPSSKFACVLKTSVLPQRLVAAAVQTMWLVAAMCRRDVSPRCVAAICRIVCLGL